MEKISYVQRIYNESAKDSWESILCYILKIDGKNSSGNNRVNHCLVPLILIFLLFNLRTKTK